MTASTQIASGDRHYWAAALVGLTVLAAIGYVAMTSGRAAADVDTPGTMTATVAGDPGEVVAAARRASTQFGWTVRHAEAGPAAGSFEAETREGCRVEVLVERTDSIRCRVRVHAAGLHNQDATCAQLGGRILDSLKRS